MITTETVAMVAKIVVIFLILFHVAPIMAWVERRGSALMQNRLGPNRLGPLGLFQSLADGIKFLFKEDPIPGHVEKLYYVLAPIISFIPAFMTFAAIPFASEATINGTVVRFQVANLDVGLIYVLAIASLGVYGIIMAGWASNNKYALLGSLRSSSQMISYELSLGLSLVSIIMIFQNVNLMEIAKAQAGAWHVFGLTIPFLPHWGALLFPVGPMSFLIFLTAAFAETNRLPFDLPEGESEIVAGYHLEYGSMKFAVFMMAEYVNMFTASAMIATLFFGGWQIWPLQPLLDALHLTGGAYDLVRILLEMGCFFGKVVFFMWFFVWVRWTLPRFRYDQLMDLGWKIMLPLSLANVLATGAMIYYGWI